MDDQETKEMIDTVFHKLGIGPISQAVLDTVRATATDEGASGVLFGGNVLLLPALEAIEGLIAAGKIKRDKKTINILLRSYGSQYFSAMMEVESIMSDIAGTDVLDDIRRSVNGRERKLQRKAGLTSEDVDAVRNKLESDPAFQSLIKKFADAAGVEDCKDPDCPLHGLPKGPEV